jgi:hypothetical protein
MSFTCVKNKGICDGCMECRWNEDNIETEEALRCDFCGCEIKDSNEDSVMSGSHVWCVECWDELNDICENVRKELCLIK